jgi:hypothetical protein
LSRPRDGDSVSSRAITRRGPNVISDDESVEISFCLTEHACTRTRGTYRSSIPRHEGRSSIRQIRRPHRLIRLTMSIFRPERFPTNSSSSRTKILKTLIGGRWRTTAPLTRNSVETRIRQIGIQIVVNGRFAMSTGLRSRAVHASRERNRSGSRTRSEVVVQADQTVLNEVLTTAVQCQTSVDTVCLDVPPDWREYKELSQIRCSFPRRIRRPASVVRRSVRYPGSFQPAVVIRPANSRAELHC